MTKSISNGRCYVCNETVDKSKMTVHLRTCKRKMQNKEGEPFMVFHILVEGKYSPKYWMHFLVDENEDFYTIDSFLRDVWVECCGHLSAFRVGNIEYSGEGEDEDIDSLDKGREVFLKLGFPEQAIDRVISNMRMSRPRSMGTILKDALIPKTKFIYEYDFGSTTELVLKVISKEKLEVKRNLQVIARNEALKNNCKCGNIATNFCNECEEFICEKCTKKHKCEEYMIFPIVNSPRMGVCGYSGPADDEDYR